MSPPDRSRRGAHRAEPGRSLPGHVMVGGRRRRRRWVLGGVLVAGLAAAAMLGLDPDVLRVVGTAPDQDPEIVADDPSADAGEVAGAFLDAWQAQDWDQLQGLTLDPDLDAAEIHRTAATTLEITDSSYTTGDPVVEDDGDVVVPFDGRWELDGLGEVTFSTSMTLRETAAGYLRVAWWYPVVHPDLTADRSFQRVRVFAPRAPIVAADGTPLVTTSERIQVGAQLGRVADPDAVAEVVARTSGANEAEVAAALSEASADPAGFTVLAEVDRDTFEEARGELTPTAGVTFRVQPVREGELSPGLQRYVGRIGPVTAELIEEFGEGYATGDVVGTSGLERAFQRQLVGEPTEEALITDSSGLVTSLQYREGSDAAPLETTFDPAMQSIAEDVVADVGRPTALVAIDQGSGEIRAAASAPFDDTERAIGGRYPPGSTFKVIGATARLAAGGDPDESVACPGDQEFGGLTLSNAGGFALGTTSLERAFARSCNTTFGQVATELGAEGMAEGARALGFGVEYSPGIPSVGGSYPEPADTAELAASGIGQARVTASPMHMASVAAAIASGSWQAPHLVRGADLPEPTPLDPEVRDGVAQMMRSVVTDGTGGSVALDGEDVYAKTGTAEFNDEGGSLGNHAWLLGYRGDIAFAVIVEGGGGGGTVAGPVAARFLEAIEDLPALPTRADLSDLPTPDAAATPEEPEADDGEAGDGEADPDDPAASPSPDDGLVIDGLVDPTPGDDDS